MPIRNTRSTVIDSSGKAAPSIVRSIRTPPKPKFLPEHVGDQHTLARRLDELAQLAHDAHSISTGNMFTGAMLLKNVIASAGTAIQIRHGLGRSPNWMAVNVSGGNAFVASVVTPADISPNDQLWLDPVFSTVCDLVLF
jgi:hypothetical protein